MEKIVIVSQIPGRIRGGMAHPRAAEHELGAIKREALAEIYADPVLVVVLGELVTDGNFSALIDANEAARRPDGAPKSRLRAR